MPSAASGNTTRDRRRSKADVVFDELYRHILGEGLQVDHVLPTERELATRFRVSRHVVREALGRLKTMGVLTARTKRGTRLAQCSLGDVFKTQLPLVVSNHESLVNLYDLRMAIEMGNALQVLEIISKDQIDDLRKKVRHMTRCRTVVELAAVECGFHITILSLSGNPMIGELGGIICRFFQRYVERSKGKLMTPVREHQIALHAPIIEWLESRKPSGVWKAFRKHARLRDAISRM